MKQLTSEAVAKIQQSMASELCDVRDSVARVSLSVDVLRTKIDVVLEHCESSTTHNQPIRADNGPFVYEYVSENKIHELYTAANNDLGAFFRAAWKATFDDVKDYTRSQKYVYYLCY